jgi:hemolysin III
MVQNNLKRKEFQNYLSKKTRKTEEIILKEKALKNTKALISSKDTNEYFNAISHIFGAIITIPAIILLIVLSVMQQKWLHVTTFSIYGISLFLSFLFSSLLHSFLIFGKYKKVLGIFDHNAIYLLIAGSYTPIAIHLVDGWFRWLIVSIIWCLAIFLVILKSVFFDKINKYLSMGGYLLMGWFSLVIVKSIYLKAGIYAVILCFLGGLSYTIGGIIFLKEKPNPYLPYFGYHEIWHILVFLGNILFYFFMLFFVLPF